MVHAREAVAQHDVVVVQLAVREEQAVHVQVVRTLLPALLQRSQRVRTLDQLLVPEAFQVRVLRRVVAAEPLQHDAVVELGEFHRLDHRRERVQLVQLLLHITMAPRLYVNTLQTHREGPLLLLRSAVLPQALQKHRCLRSAAAEAREMQQQNGGNARQRLAPHDSLQQSLRSVRRADVSVARLGLLAVGQRAGGAPLLEVVVQLLPGGDDRFPVAVGAHELHHGVRQLDLLRGGEGSPGEGEEIDPKSAMREFTRKGVLVRDARVAVR